MISLTHMEFFCSSVDVFIKCRLLFIIPHCIPPSLPRFSIYNCADYSNLNGIKVLFTIDNAAFSTWIGPNPKAERLSPNGGWQMNKPLKNRLYEMWAMTLKKVENKLIKNKREFRHRFHFIFQRSLFFSFLSPLSLSHSIAKQSSEIVFIALCIPFTTFLKTSEHNNAFYVRWKSFFHNMPNRKMKNFPFSSLSSIIFKWVSSVCVRQTGYSHSERIRWKKNVWIQISLRTAHWDF